MKFDFDFLKDRYDYELQRREQITAALTLPVGILTILGGAMAAMARSFSYKNGFLTWVFGTLLGLAGSAFFLCMLNLGRTYHRHTYIYLPLLGRSPEGSRGMAGRSTRRHIREERAMTPSSTSWKRVLSTPLTKIRSATTCAADYLFWSRTRALRGFSLNRYDGHTVRCRSGEVLRCQGQTPRHGQTTQTPQRPAPQPPQFPPNREIRDGDRPRERQVGM